MITINGNDILRSGMIIGKINGSNLCDRSGNILARFSSGMLMDKSGNKIAMYSGGLDAMVKKAIEYRII